MTVQRKFRPPCQRRVLDSQAPDGQNRTMRWLMTASKLSIPEHAEFEMAKLPP